MPARIRRSLSFANVCSFLALVVALGTGGAYAANTVFSSDIVDGEVKTPDLAQGDVTSAKIRNNTGVQTIDLADGAVTSAKVLDETVGAGDLGANSVGTAEIQTDGVAASEIQDNAIDGGEIIDNSLEANDLASGSVGSAEIADGAVNGIEVANGSLTMSDIKGADNSGAIGLSAGAVANGRCEDFNISVPGADVGDAVVLSLRGAAPEGMLFYGVRVAVDDQVVMKLCNLTGGTSPAISDLPIRLFTLD